MEKLTQLARRFAKKGWAYYLIYAFLLSTLLFLLCGGFLFYYYSHQPPDYQPLKHRHFNAYSIVYSEEDEVVGKFLMDNRIPVPYERIPKTLVDAFIAAEDAEFFRHKGIDFRGIARAMVKNLMAGRIVQGGSTITQQVTKIFFLTPKRSLLRKLKEVAYAFGLERNLSKEEILSLYLNNVYLGNGAYGVEAAAESYFNKRTEQLNLAEMAMIAGLVKAPSRYSPINNLRRAKERQIYVLTRMTDLGFISQEQKEKAQQTPLKIQSRESAYFSKAPYFTEFIRQLVERKYGKEKLYQEGLRIYTTLDLSLQRAAQKDVDKGLRDLDKRQGFRGPIQTLSQKEMNDLQKKGSSNPLRRDEIYEGVIVSKDDSRKYFAVWVEDRKAILPYSESAWALQINPTATYGPQRVKQPRDLLNPGDVVYVRVKELPTGKDQSPILSLEQEPLIQGALLCLDPKTGYVKAMVGGRNFGESQFNRALYSRRQPGSAFKPIIYAAALEKGYHPSTIIMDSPVEYENYDEGTYWAPKNYDKNFMGPITFRNALAHSRNVVTVKILEDIGVGYVLKFIKRLGIESPIKRDLSVALGTSGVSMLELAQAFGVFANGGERVKPIFIKKIVTLKGEVLEENYPYVEFEERDEEEEGNGEPASPLKRERVISPQHAYIMTHLLEGVVQHGTGQRAKILNRPIAGKTGTSSDYTDAWFIGYTPSLLTAVWVGFDEKTSLGKDETGARAALPIWIAFMSKTLADTPVEAFKPPPGIVMKRVNIETGLLTEEESDETILEAFVEGMLPEEKEPERKGEGSPSSPPLRDLLPRESPGY
ncbi:MAG: penicillin-binding protein 1A [Thermodesulfobacteriota bacterium]